MHLSLSAEVELLDHSGVPPNVIASARHRSAWDPYLFSKLAQILIGSRYDCAKILGRHMFFVRFVTRPAC